MAEEQIVKTKEFIYRGKPLEELKSLDIREVAKYLPSSSRRTVLRKFDVIEKFVRRCLRKQAKNKKIKTQSRDMVIVPQIVGLTIAVYNGKSFEDVQLTTDMIGHRLGEFTMTRRAVKHSAAGIGATKSSKAQKK